MSSPPRSLPLQLAVLTALSAVARPQGEAIALASVNTGGVAGDGRSTAVSISANGRFVAFESFASDLVAGDTNGGEDTFVHDRVTRTTRRASVSSSGTEQHWQLPPAGIGWRSPPIPHVSDDGQIVLFASTAADLVAGDSGAFTDVFLHDFTSGATVRVSSDPAGNEGNGESGALVMSLCYLGSCPTLGYPHGMDLSPDGRFVVFTSAASNLVAGDLNGAADVFLLDRTLGTMEIVSLTSTGAAAGGDSFNPAVSDDGRYVVFNSSAPDVVAADNNQSPDVFVRDRLLGTTVCASLTPDGVPGGAGSFFSFTHFPHCPACGGTHFEGPALSIAGDGSRVAFAAGASDFLPGPWVQHRGTFVHDLATGTTVLASVATDSTGADSVPAGGFADPAGLSVDGRFVAFWSNADLLPPASSDGEPDLFIRDLARRVTVLATAGSIPDDGVSAGDLAADGHQVAFSSHHRFTPEDQQDHEDVYARGDPLPAFLSSCEGTAALCPCANGGAPGAGCAHSSNAAGARLHASGVASVGHDSLVVTVSGVPSGSFVIFAEATGRAASPAVFGDGLRCVVGTITRLGPRAAHGGSASYGVFGDVPIAQATAVPPGGARRHVQAWYRNAAAFCTPATFNLSNLPTIPWAP